MGHSSVQFYPPPSTHNYNTRHNYNIVFKMNETPFLFIFHQTIPMDVSLCLCLLQVRTKLEASRESTWRSSGGGGGGTVTTGTSHNLRVNKHWSDNSIILLLLFLFHFLKGMHYRSGLASPLVY